MPLVTIKSLPPKDLSRIEPMLADVRDSGAKALGSRVENIWVQFQLLQPGYYLQGLTNATEPQQQTHSPTVLIQAQQGRTPEERTDLTKAVTEAISRGLQVPAENVWAYYEEMLSQDVWFNGKWS